MPSGDIIHVARNFLASVARVPFHHGSRNENDDIVVVRLVGDFRGGEEREEGNSCFRNFCFYQERECLIINN